MNKIISLVWIFILINPLLVGAQQPATAAAGDFAVWLQDFRTEALNRGISPATVNEALVDLAPLVQIIELDRRQLKKRQISIDQYLKKALPPQKVAYAVRLYRENRELLNQIEATYQVPAHYLVALWGVESDFGRNQGKTPVVAALATLAYDGRRGDFFRKELFDALTILDQGHIPLGQMRGSWAGALGQVQFMPSTFLRHAVDFDGDGRKDIWNSRPDALASAANYLRAIGWHHDFGWGERVILLDSFNTALAGLETRKTLGEWRRLGVRDIDGPDHLKASLLLPDDKRRPAFLAYDNYRVLRTWNRSTSFVLKVGHLAQRIYAEGRKK